MFETYLARWKLRVDGDPISTSTAHILPVLWQEKPAMLKLSSQPDQQRGSALMEWWAGDGTADIFARDDNALVMERAMGKRSLAEMARVGEDDDACRVLCTTGNQLHRQRSGDPPPLIPLNIWFRDLETAAEQYGGILLRSRKAARDLLAEPREQSVLLVTSTTTTCSTSVNEAGAPSTRMV